MPKIIERKILKEKCPECNSQLVKIIEKWDPFPDEEDPAIIKTKSCSSCDYKLVIRNDLNRSVKVPYVRHEKNFRYA